MIHFKRADRVGGQIQKEISDLVQKEIRDPRLDFVTIMRVSITDDLRSARVYFTVSEGGSKIDVMAGFKSASGYLRRKLSGRLKLKYIPELEFLYDESFDRATRVEKVLKAIRNGSQMG